MTETVTNKPTWVNPLEDREKVTLSEYLEFYSSRVTQDSEQLFVRDFLFPILGESKIKYAVPQYPFIDSEGKNRRIDFVKDENSNSISEQISEKVKKYFNAEEDEISDIEKSLLKEESGRYFLTKEYYIKKI